MYQQNEYKLNKHCAVLVEQKKSTTIIYLILLQTTSLFPFPLLYLMLFPFSLLGVCGCGQLLILMTRTRYDHQHQISLRLDNCFRGGPAWPQLRNVVLETWQQVRQKLMVGTLLIGLWNKENGSFSILASFQIECKMIPLTSPLNK